MRDYNKDLLPDYYYWYPKLRRMEHTKDYRSTVFLQYAKAGRGKLPDGYEYDGKYIISYESEDDVQITMVTTTPDVSPIRHIYAEMPAAGSKEWEQVNKVFDDLVKRLENNKLKENRTMRRDRRERIGNDLSEYQKWVDYDMKKYGRISDITKGKIRKAGLSIVKDQYGDYEVIADRPIKEGCGKLNEKSDYNALRKAKEFIKNATTKEGFYDKIRAILKDAFIEDWDIKQLQRLADAKYEQLGEVKESYKRKLKEAKERHIKDLTDDELIALRKEIVLGSLFTRDYENSFGIDAREVCNFFDGFLDDAEYKFEGEFDRYPKDVNELYDYCDNDDDLIEYAYGIEW